MRCDSTASCQTVTENMIYKTFTVNKCIKIFVGHRSHHSWAKNYIFEACCLHHQGQCGEWPHIFDILVVYISHCVVSSLLVHCAKPESGQTSLHCHHRPALVLLNWSHPPSANYLHLLLLNLIILGNSWAGFMFKPKGFRFTFFLVAVS
jgi:hypothetical protein